MDKHGTLPWTKSCFVCGEDNPHGLQLKSRIEGNRVVIDYTTRPYDVGYREIIHGGLGMTLLDEVMTWASLLSFGRMCVAAELTTRLKRPMILGMKLRIEGWVKKCGSRLCLTQGAVFDEQRTTLVTATGKYMPMPADQASLADKDFVLNAETLGLDDILKQP